jgi:uncharacterized protein (UPF0276 family)
VAANPLYSGNALGVGPIPARAGIGLRIPHHRWVINHRPAVAWLEVHPENYMTESVHKSELDLICRDHLLSLHSVGLSLGSAEGVQDDHLARFDELITRYQPGLISDHLSWSQVNGVYFPDLLPLPYTEEALEVVARNIDKVQTKLRRRLLVENPSSYFCFASSVLTEAEFLDELVRRSDCGVLLDVNNIYVSARNHDEDPHQILASYLDSVPPEAIGEIHLAGHFTRILENGRELRIDDHGSQVCREVWQLYERTIATLGIRPTLIEWDTAIPPFTTLQAEARTAQAILDASTKREASHAVAG